MFKPVRIIATILFIASIALIFVGAFVLRSGVRNTLLVITSQHHIDRSLIIQQLLCISKLLSRFLSCVMPEYRSSFRHHRVPCVYMVHTFVYPIRTFRGSQSIRYGIENANEIFFSLWDVSLCHLWNQVSTVSYKSNACPMLSFLDGVQLYLLFDWLL